MRALWGQLYDANGTAADHGNTFFAKSVWSALAHILGVDGGKKITEVQLWKGKLETSEKIQNGKMDAENDGKPTKWGSGVSGIYEL